MLLIILFVVLLVLGSIISALWYNARRGFWDHDAWCGIGAGATVVGLAGIIVCVVFCLCVQVPKDVNYQEALYEREVLVYRLEHREENIVGNEMLYTEIVEFNNDLRIAKKWAGNPWVGCFHNDLIAGIDYIEYKEAHGDG